jgi:tRNA(His) 5'-end guanylyltransferase
VRAACKGQSQPITAAYQPFNQFTQDGKNMDFYSQLLDQAIASMIERKEEKDLDSLFTSLRTSALTSTIKGLDDFELISFLVVKG